MTQARNYCFTLNNYTDKEYEDILTMKCKYLVVGKEKGESGTPHLQGYVEFTSGKRLDTLKKLIPKAHFEERKGTAQQASDYCKKEGEWSEIGTISKQGKRSDLTSVAKSIIEDKKPLTQIASEHPELMIRYSKGLQVLKTLTLTDRDVNNPPTVIWRYGLSGVGKTRYCIENHTSYYIKDGTMWWDSYEQQEAIIIDDFDGRWPYRDLLRLLDRYPYQGQFKGGYVKINSPYIYITCEYPPSHFWKGNEFAQVVRRITEIVEVK